MRARAAVACGVAIAAALAVTLVADGNEEVRALQLPAALARPTPIARAGSGDLAAFAGNRLLIGQHDGRNLRLAAVGADGRPAGAPLLTYRSGSGTTPEAALSASPTAVSLVVTQRDEDDDEPEPNGAQAFVGAAGEGLRALGPPRDRTPTGFYPAATQVDDARIFLTEHQADSVYDGVEAARHFVMDGPSAGPRALTLPKDALDPVFAGDLVAYTSVTFRRKLETSRVVVRNWRTGAERWSARLSGSAGSPDLRADGAVVVAATDDRSTVGFTRVDAFSPDGRPRLVARNADSPVWAGTSIVFTRRLPGRAGENAEQLAVAEPDGRVRPFGVPADHIWSVQADDGRVLWNAHGCLLVADLQAAATQAPARGPCPRSELVVDRENSDESTRQPVLGADRRVRVPLRCIAAPPPGCRVRVVSLGWETEPRSFTVAPGKLRRVSVRLTARGYAEAVRDDGQSGFHLRAVVTDPDGRRSDLDDANLNVAIAGRR